MSRLFFWSVLGLVLAALIAGFAVVGGPGHARAEARDQTRRADLRRIADATICEAGEQAAFSRACRDAERSLRDPLTDAAYEVTRTADAIEVCATFEVARESDDAGRHREGRLHFDGPRGCLRYTLVARSGQWVIQ